MIARFVASFRDSSLQLELQGDGTTAILDAPRPFENPLSDADLADLSWYFDVYPITAGTSQHFRAKQIEARLPRWGSALFGSLFPQGSEARAEWEAIGEEASELWIHSESTAMLALPWELCRSSEQSQPLSRITAITRSPQLPSPRVETGEPQHVPRRLLLVISRPKGTPEVSYLLFARTLVSQLRALYENVDIEVLRPPTFDAFRERLQQAADAREHFDIIHFDGHGSIEGGTATLAFETKLGVADNITAARLLDALGGVHVPLFVLAACHSGSISSATLPEGAIALSLAASDRVSSVVAMSHAVCSDTARVFLPAFYGAVFNGLPIGEAVTCGRRALHETRARRRGAATIQLDDWCVPVHYAVKPLRFASVQPSGEAAFTTAALAGRDPDYFAVERLLRASRIVIIEGMAGIGKSTFATEFAAWFAETEPGMQDLRTVNARSVDMPSGEWSGCVVVEGIESLQRPTAALEALLAAKHPSGRSIVIVPCRRRPSFLDELPSHTLRPLAHEDAIELFARDEPLATGVIAESLRFLDGHPDCITHAAVAPPGDTFPVAIGDETLARLESAFRSLAEEDQKYLWILARLGPWIDLQVLKHLTGYFHRPDQDEESPPPSLVPERVEVAPFSAWPELMERCCRAGIALHEEQGLYRVHPALGILIRRDWQRTAGDAFPEEWDRLTTASENALLATAMQLAMFLPMGSGFDRDAPLPGPMAMFEPSYVRKQLSIHEPRVKQIMLRRVSRGDLRSIVFATDALTAIWSESGRHDVAFAWKLLDELGPPDTPDAAFGAAGLLRFFALQQIAISGTRSRDAEPIIRTLLDRIGSPRAKFERRRRSEFLWVLAMYLDVRGRSREAEPYASHAVSELEAIGDEELLGRVKRSHAVILKNQGRAYTAVDILRKLDDRPLFPSEEAEHQHQNAADAFDRRDLGRAKELNLAILAKSESSPRVRARAYHELGIISQHTGDHDAAEQWFLKSLALKRPFAARQSSMTLLALGQLAYERGRDDEARSWFERVLDVSEGDSEWTVTLEATLALASIAKRQGDRATSLAHLVRSLENRIRFGRIETGVRRRLRDLLEDETAESLLAAWESVHAMPADEPARLRLASAADDVGVPALAGELVVSLKKHADPTIRAESLLLSANSVALSDRDAALRECELAIEACSDMAVISDHIRSILGRAHATKGILLCAESRINEGLTSLQSAVAELEPLANAGSIHEQWNYAHTLRVVYAAQRDLGRIADATATALRATEIVRRCHSAGAAFRPALIETLYDAGVLLLKSGDATAATGVAAEAQELLLQEYPGAASCSAEPSGGAIVRLAADALQESGHSDEIPQLLAKRIDMLDPFISDGAPRVVEEYVGWSIELIGSSLFRESDQRLRRIDRLVAALEGAKEMPRDAGRIAAALSRLVWECNQRQEREAAERLRSAISILESREPDLSPVALAAAKADFDLTLGSGRQLAISEMQTLLERLEIHIAPALRDDAILRYAFVNSALVAAYCQKGEPEAAVSYADAFASVLRAKPFAAEQCLLYLVQCLHNLCIAFNAHGEPSKAIHRFQQLLLAIRDVSDDSAYDPDAEADVDDEEDEGNERPMSRMVQDTAVTLIGSLAEDNRLDEAFRTLNLAIEIAGQSPRNELLIWCVVTGTSNLLLRIKADRKRVRPLADQLRQLHSRAPKSKLVVRALVVALMSLIHAEVTAGDVSAARAAMSEMLEVAGSPLYVPMIVFSGFPLISAYLRRDDVAAATDLYIELTRRIAAGAHLEPQIPMICHVSTQLIERHFNARSPRVIDVAQELRALAKRYPESVELAEATTLAIVNVIGIVRDTDTFRTMLRDFQEWTARHCNSEVMTDIARHGSANVIAAAGNHRLVPAGEVVFEALLDDWKRNGSSRGAPDYVVTASERLMSAYHSADEPQRMLDTFLRIAREKAFSETWAKTLAGYAGAVARVLWPTSSAPERDKVAEVINAMWRYRACHDALIDAAGEELIKQIRHA